MGRSAGTGAQSALLAYLLVLAAGVWLFGVLQHSERRGISRAASISLLLLAVLGLGALPAAEARPVAESEREANAAEANAARAFEPAEIRAELARGRPVFVYFTADWCLTCKVNEHAVLSSSRVRAELSRLGVETFVGDWTRRDERIRAELARFGKAGVPMYLVYSPAAPDQPVVLPELLTVDLLIHALATAAPQTEDRT